MKKKILYTSIIDKIYKLFGIADNRLFTQLPPFTHYDHRLLIVSKNSFRGFIYFFFILKKKKSVFPIKIDYESYMKEKLKSNCEKSTFLFISKKETIHLDLKKKKT